MKRKLRIISFLLSVATMFCLSFAGCDKPDNGDSGDNGGISEVTLESIQAKYDASLYQYSGKPVTVRLATWDSAGYNIERAVMETVVKAFNNRYPTIKIEYDIMSNYEMNYAGNIATGDLHDVFVVTDGVFGNWVTGGKMENLEPYIASSDLIVREEMHPSVVDRYSYNPTTGKTGSGNQYTLARDISSFVMYYNKDYFDAKGVTYPPSDRIMTIDEATEMWKALTTYDDNGEISVYGSSALDICGLVWSAGGDFLNAEKTAFPTEEKDLKALKKAYQFVQDSYYKDKICPTVALDAATMFNMQKVATCIAGSWNVSTFRSLDFNWDIAYIPAFEENPQANCWSGSAGLSVYTGSKCKEASWKFVEYIASKEGQEILMSTGTQIPIYENVGKDIVERESKLGPANYEILIKSAKTQKAGRWTYLKNQQWYSLGYDLYSGNLLDSNADERWTTDRFLEKCKEIVNQYVG